MYPMVTISSETSRATMFIQAESVTARAYANTEAKAAASALAFENFTNRDRDFKIERKFQDLSEKWKAETTGMSSLSQIISNKYYLRIIALGEGVIPCILKHLRTQAAPWFAALRALTEREDIGREYAGNFRKIADAWIAWGQKEGHI